MKIYYCGLFLDGRKVVNGENKDMDFKKKLLFGIGIVSTVIMIATVVLGKTGVENTISSETEVVLIESGESSEEPRPQFILMQFKNQIRETVANLHTFEGFSIYIPESWQIASKWLTPPVELTLKGAGGEIWIERYEDEMLSEAEARFQAEGYVYDEENVKWQKAEGTLIKRVKLEEKFADVWAVFVVYDEAYLTGEEIDMVADTCMITGTTENRPEKTREELILVSDAYYHEPAKYFYEMDWEKVGTKISAEENETLQKFIPILEGEAFTWIYQGDYKEEQNAYNHDRMEVTIREMLARQMDVHGLEQVEPLLDSFYFADVFQSGSEDVVLCLRNMAYEWLILHEENGIIYGIDIPIRGFSEVYENGLYVGSNGADDWSYHRMKFADGDYTVEDVARVYRDTLIIDGEEKLAAEYEAWKAEHLKGMAQRYNPLGEKE